MKKIFPVFVLPAILIASALPAQAQPSEGAQPSQTITSQTITSQTIAQANNETTAIAEEFINLLADAQFNDALRWYNSAVASNVTSESLMTVWQDIEAAHGALQRQVSSQTLALDGENGSHVVLVTCEFAQGSRDVLITFSGNQIIDFSIVDG